jgi:hypothetical protein
MVQSLRLQSPSNQTFLVYLTFIGTYVDVLDIAPRSRPELRPSGLMCPLWIKA